MGLYLMKTNLLSFALTFFAASIGSASTTYYLNTSSEQTELVSQSVNTVSSNDLETIRKTIQVALPATPIRSVSPSAIAGLYEVITPNGLMHTDKQGRYMFVGGIYDPKTNKDLIKARKLELGFVDKPTTQKKRTSPTAQPVSEVITHRLSMKFLILCVERVGKTQKS